MNCPNCTTEISDDSKFCSECGTPVSSAGDVGPANGPSEPTSLDILMGKYPPRLLERQVPLW